MFDADPVALLARELLRDRARDLVTETCAWAVGLSDQPHHARRGGRAVATGLTLGQRAAAALPLSGEEDAPLELGETRPGSFGDALGALQANGRLHADRFEQQVLVPFVLETCVLATERAALHEPQAWAELLDELGEDGSDPVAVVRAAEWEAPLRTEAEQLVLAALGPAPLVQVEAEGLPLSLVRAAEAELRAATGEAAQVEPRDDDELAGALFLAETALRDAALSVPVPPDEAPVLLDALLAEGLDPDEVLEVLPHLPVLADTADAVAERLRQD
ncbi:MAG: uncharacterized protein JWN08_1443 [Frankiales bacterium]|nr:uncharacterized protein [Frankiales bacterium]